MFGNLNFLFVPQVVFTCQCFTYFGDRTVCAPAITVDVEYLPYTFSLAHQVLGFSFRCYVMLSMSELNVRVKRVLLNSFAYVEEQNTIAEG